MIQKSVAAAIDQIENDALGIIIRDTVFTDQDVDALAAAIRTHPDLRMARFVHSPLTTAQVEIFIKSAIRRGPDTVPWEFGGRGTHYGGLLNLEFCSCRLDDAACGVIAAALPFTNIRDLYLGGDGDDITGAGLAMIDRAIEMSTCIESVHISNYALFDAALARSKRRTVAVPLVLAFVQGILAARTPIEMFLKRDGDTAMQHRVARFLI